jgi:hypothetical protein
LDIDPHDGTTETQFLDALHTNGFRGIILCDDIKLNDGMKEFWDGIPSHLKKVDLTAWGHWSGTGAVIYDPSYIDLRLA